MPPVNRGGSRNFGNGGGEAPNRAPKAEASPENFEKLDAISCNMAYIFEIRMASDIIQNGAIAEQKTVAATISIHTHTYTPPTLPKIPRISATIKSKFNFKNIFSDIVYNVENKIDFAKNGGPGTPPPFLDPPLINNFI